MSEMELKRAHELEEIAKRLRRWNRWRRGEGEFAWNGQPPTVEMPESGQSYGALLEAAASALEEEAGRIRGGGRGEEA